MVKALRLAAEGEAAGEVPVGAIIVLDGEVVGEGWNRPISSHDPSAHAEVIAIRDAATRTDNYRLPGATLYVTLEPCLMCMGAIIHARISRLVYGAPDPKVGAAQGPAAVQLTEGINHELIVEGGVLEDPCAEMLKKFFRERREK